VNVVVRISAQEQPFHLDSFELPSILFPFLIYTDQPKQVRLSHLPLPLLPPRRTPARNLPLLRLELLPEQSRLINSTLFFSLPLERTAHPTLIRFLPSRRIRRASACLSPRGRLDGEEGFHPLSSVRLVGVGVSDGDRDGSGGRRRGIGELIIGRE
jgi:hypothetical protein